MGIRIALSIIIVVGSLTTGMTYAVQTFNEDVSITGGDLLMNNNNMNLGTGTLSTSSYSVTGNGGNFIFDRTNLSSNLIIFRNDDTMSDGNQAGTIMFQAKNDAGTPENVGYARIIGLAGDVSDGTEDGTFLLQALQDGTFKTYLELNSAGNDQIEVRADIDMNLNDIRMNGGDLLAQGGDVNLGAGSLLLTNYELTDNAGDFGVVRSNFAPNVLFQRDDTSIVANNQIGRFTFEGNNNAVVPEFIGYTRIVGLALDVTDGSEDGGIVVQAIRGGALTTYIDINQNNDGEINFLRPLSMSGQEIFTDGGDIETDGGTLYLGDSTDPAVIGGDVDLRGGSIVDSTNSDICIGACGS